MAFKVKSTNWKGMIAIIIGAILCFIGGYGVDLAIRPTKEGDVVLEASYQLELAEEQVPAVIETEEGQIEENIATVESVDGNQLVTECGEDEECGQGWYVDTSSPIAFKNATYGQCIDTDGHYGSQCWDLANLFWQNYAGRTLSTCGTGAAKGTLNCWEKNAEDDFVMIWDANSLQVGDIAVFTNGQYGHIGVVMGPPTNGYIALLGTNQGGASCPGGGSSANIINISLKNFGGAFRPKDYIIPEPVIPISNCVQWHVLRGDTMSKIMMECEGTIKYGEIMNEYAKTWYSLVYKPGQSVYDGWHSKTGVGLYAGDDIEHRTGN